MRVLDYILTISFGRIFYCGCFDLFCIWVCVGVGVLVMCVLVFTAFCIVFTVFFVLFRLCIILFFVLSVLV